MIKFEAIIDWEIELRLQNFIKNFQDVDNCSHRSGKIKSAKECCPLPSLLPIAGVAHWSHPLLLVWRPFKIVSLSFIGQTQWYPDQLHFKQTSFSNRIFIVINFTYNCISYYLSLFLAQLLNEDLVKWMYRIGNTNVEVLVDLYILIEGVMVTRPLSFVAKV